MSHFMISYEYIELRFDFGDLTEMNSLSSAGFRVVHVAPLENGNEYQGYYIALMERPIPEQQCLRQAILDNATKEHKAPGILSKLDLQPELEALDTCIKQLHDKLELDKR